MNDPMKLLALARAIEPDADYQLVRSDVLWDDVQSQRTFKTFDPANNSDQAMAVQVWLLKQHPSHRYEGRTYLVWFEISEHAVYKMISDKGAAVTIQSWPLYGTAAGLRKAVTEAGRGVVS